MLKIPSPVLDKKKKKKLAEFMNCDKKKKKEEKKRNHPVYSVQYLAKNNHKGTWPKTYSKTCRDHGSRLGTKEKKTM